MNKHDRVETYRVVFRAGNWATLSKRYYTVYHSSEALQDMHYAFHSGHVHAKRIKVYRVEEYNRYSHKWMDCTEAAFKHAKNLFNVQRDGKKITMTRVANSKK